MNLHYNEELFEELIRSDYAKSLHVDFVFTFLHASNNKTQNNKRSFHYTIAIQS